MGKRVLVVDDDSLVRLIVCHYFSTAGWLSLFAANGREALRELRTEAVDLVVTDLLLPDMNGVDIAPATGYAGPIVFMTGAIGPGGPLPGPVLRKPFSEDELKELLVSLALETSFPGPPIVPRSR